MMDRVLIAADQLKLLRLRESFVGRQRGGAAWIGCGCDAFEPRRKADGNRVFEGQQVREPVGQALLNEDGVGVCLYQSNEHFEIVANALIRTLYAVAHPKRLEQLARAGGGV